MTTTSRSRTRTKIGSGIAGVGLAALAVLGFSNAAFHAETDNAQNNWSTRATEGEVSLEDNLDAPLFSVGLNGAPMPYTGAYDEALFVDDAEGETGIADREITVTYTGSEAADVRMYLAPGYTQTNGLAADTIVTVTRGATEIYNGPLANMPTDYAGASGNAWLVQPSTDGATATYTFEIDVEGAEENATLGNVKFVWAAEQQAPSS